MPDGSSLDIVTVSGEKVANIQPTQNRGEWDGKSENGKFASQGVYYYILRQGSETLEKGVLILSDKME